MGAEARGPGGSVGRDTLRGYETAPGAMRRMQGGSWEIIRGRPGSRSGWERRAKREADRPGGDEDSECGGNDDCWARYKRPTNGKFGRKAVGIGIARPECIEWGQENGITTRGHGSIQSKEIGPGAD
ncbi:hypothetical protein OPQ81_009398 [Rhizoctonia solani]|nr:hypothetical protein OPQ81_009398 [Rhizoctonia solani]